MKKSNYFFKKACLAIAAIAMGISVNAETYFVSASGNDTKDGSSQEEAFKTFKKACEVAVTGDMIVIMGTVPVAKDEEAEPSFAGLTIVGLGNNAVLDGGGKYPIMKVWNDVVDGVGEGAAAGYDYFFANLTFQNALRAASGGGGAINIDANVKVRFSNCKFISNRTNCDPGTGYPRDGEADTDLWWNSDDQWNGGAIRMNGGEIEIYNCTFGGTKTGQGNRAFRGGALDIVNASSITIEHSKFMNNNTFVKGDGKRDDKAVGGAIAINNCPNIVIHNCLFDNNYTFGGPSLNGGGLDGAAGGALYFVPTVGGSVTISNSSIVNNKTDQHGGAISAKGNNINYTFINCTFADNQCKDAGGAVFAPFGGNNAELNVINCTFSSNKTQSGSRSMGSGLMIMEPKKIFRLYNSIIENNTTNNYEYADISYTYEHSVIESIEIKNSYVGDYYTDNDLNNDNATGDLTYYGYIWSDFTFESLSGISTYSVQRTDDGAAYFPLREGYPAVAGGDFALLTEFRKDDQFGTPRGNPACSIGAVEGIIEEKDSPVDVVPKEDENYTPDMKEIIETETGTFAVAADGSAAVGYYSILGVKLDKEPNSGLFIVKYSNGATIKVLK